MLEASNALTCSTVKIIELFCAATIGTVIAMPYSKVEICNRYLLFSWEELEQLTAFLLSQACLQDGFLALGQTRQSHGSRHEMHLMTAVSKHSISSDTFDK